MNLCFVIQRYGLESPGGAETHCRWLATRLARRHRVEVVTTCARDYTDWSNHYPAGVSEVLGIKVTRFPVERPRSERLFALYSDIVFRDHHTPADEEEWVDQNGPFAPRWWTRCRQMTTWTFPVYSYRYYRPSRVPRSRAAFLVPTAEYDRAIRRPSSAPSSNRPRSGLPDAEEKALVESARAAACLGGCGSGLNISSGWPTGRTGESDCRAFTSSRRAHRS